MNSLFYILGAALVSAFGPVVMALYNTYDFFEVFSEFLIFKALFFIFFIWVPYVNLKKHRAFFYDWRLISLSVFQYLLYVGSVASLGLSFQYGRSISAALLYESWPILLAVIFPLLVSRSIARLTGMDALMLGIGVIGVAFIVEGYEITHAPGDYGPHPSPPDFGLPFAFIALVLLAVSTALKARYVRLAHERYGVGALLSFTYMQIAAIPVALPLLLWPGALSSLGAIIEGHRLAADFAPTIALVAINIVSAVLFSFGSLKMRFASENLVWFLTPIFTLAMFYIFLDVTPQRYEYIGAMLVLSANILTYFKLENTLPFSISYLGFVGFGVVCIYVKGNGFEHYFELMAALIVFFAIFVSFVLERLAQRRQQCLEAALELYNEVEACRRAEAAPKALLDAVGRSAQAMAEAQHATALYARYRDLQEQLRPEEAQPARERLQERVQRYVLLRVLGVSISEVFIIVKLGLISMFCAIFLRGDGWVYDLFAFSFAASALFAIALVFQFSRDAASKIFDDKAGAIVDPSLAPGVGVPSQERTIWVIILSAIVYVCLGLCYYQYS